MPQLNAHHLAEVNRSFSAVFMQALGEARGRDEIRRLLAGEPMPMSRGMHVWKWASRTVGVNEWLDERIKRKLRLFSFSLAARKWANGIIIQGDDLEDDDNGLALYRDQIASLAEDFVEHKYALLIDLLNNGFAAARGLAYDGQFFFDTDHDDGQGPQSNRGTAALTPASYDAAVTQMMQLKKPNGLYGDVKPTHLIVPPALRSTARDILKVNNVAVAGGSQTNPRFEEVDYVVEPRLTSPTAWFLIDASKRMKPFLIGERRAVRMRAKIDPNQGAAYDRDLYEWGGDGRYNATYMWWQTMFGSTGTT